MVDNMVHLDVPQPLYDVDAELNLMAILEFVMRNADKFTTPSERARVVEWFSSRYSENDPTEATP